MVLGICIEDDAEKIRVEAYVLKKITKDLPLQPMPLALKWDHLSDLELADPEFRIPAYIDFLLGGEIFTSILYDGRRTGPRGMPSVMNICFGSVLFGIIHDSDIVDFANYTLEQEVLKDIAKLSRSYAAVVTADKKRTSAANDGGIDERLKDNHIFQDVNPITMTIELPDKGSADPGPRNV